MEKKCSFPFALALLMSCLVISVAITRSNYSDEYALLALKSHITSDPSQNIRVNWSNSTHFCHWFGVSCSARRQRVVALNLSNMQLEGTISPHIGNLSLLVFLNLSINNFHGHLPHELANLRRLKYLILRNNQFNGTIPSSFGNFPTLEKLHLGNNTLEGTIPSTLFNITTLKFLDLDTNFLQGNIPQKIGNLFNLQDLWLANNLFSGAVPLVLFNISSLHNISLPSNSFSGILGESLCNHHSTKLEWLDLADNQLSGPIPSNLSKCNDLRILALNDNKFTGSIPREICNLGKLELLYLYRNNLTGDIPREIGNLGKLKILYLGANSLTGTIPPEIGSLTKLEEITVDQNNLKGTIPSAVFNLSTLKFMNANFNGLSGQLPLTSGSWLPNLEQLYLNANQLSGRIPTFICNASQLIHLELSSNLFSNFIPNCLGNLRKLETLNLAKNSLTSKEPDFLSSLANCQHLEFIVLSQNPALNITLLNGIGNLSSLIQIFAEDCTIKGNIPSEIRNLSSLIALQLGYNQLTGTIPSSIGKLWNLQSLTLQSNKLQGSVPSEICDMRSLFALDLGTNDLFGPIPSCIGNLSSLTSLYLDSNKFNSEIPHSLWDLKDILEVDLHSNSLVGSIPLEINNLKVVTLINLSSNHLSGDIPTSIGGLQSLRKLYFSENFLKGNIPQSIGDLVSLEFLDFSRNNLSGVIPKSIERLKYLKYFDVSFNQLEGEIPNEGQFASFSSEYFLGNKALCSSTKINIPPCLGKTSSPKKGIKFILKCVLPILASLVVLAFAFVVLYKKKRKRNDKVPVQGNPEFQARWRRISYYELEHATDGFQEHNLIGKGSFGSVYKGILSDGTYVAIKVFNLQLEEAFRTFDVECQVFQNLHHRNLVKVYTTCCVPDFKALVLEFMPNWSLEKWLYSHNHFLDVLQRLNIMLDVASALEYLHHGYHTTVVHCDLKPSNILLDEDMVAHVSDFGITKLLGEGDSMTHTMTLATIGYMAPEYGSGGIVSAKCDVYNYGILLVETFTRKKPTDEMFAGEMSLKIWVEQSIPQAITQIVDPNLLSENQEEHYEAKKNLMVSIFSLSLQCSADLAERRINMKDVVIALNKIKKKFLNDVEL